MKACFFGRIKIFVLTLTLLTLLSSCKAEEKDHLAYQEYPIKAECVLTVRTEEYPFVLDIPAEGRARLTFTGSRLEGGVFGVSGREVFFINGGYTFPLTAAEDSALSVMLSGFSLSSSEMTKVTTTGAGLLVSYNHGDTGVTVALEDGVPTLMEFLTDTERFTLTINNFTSGR